MDLVEGQGEAMRLILQTFGAPEPGPLVQWNRELDCASGTGWLHPDRPDHCVRGLHHEGTLIVALWPGADLAQTSLAHETCHFVEWARSGDGDPGHRGPCFVPGGLVEQANDALWKLGEAAPGRPSP
jgi:hypothetical protein